MDRTSEHFLSSARTDIFRPFTGRHRAIFFEIVTEIYERTIGVNADFDIVLDRHTLTDIIIDALSANRDLIFNDGSEEDVLDHVDDKAYADVVRRRLKQFEILEEHHDAIRLKVIWRFTAAGKRIAKMFSETRKKTSSGRQRSVRACKAALNSFLADGNHEFLVDAYEYAATIFDDVTQIADLFAEHQRRIMANSFTTSKEALAGYLDGVKDFERRAARYFNSDNIHNHATEIIKLTEDVEALDSETLALIDRKIVIDNPALEDEANGEPVHMWMMNRIRRIVRSTRDIKHQELSRAVTDFSTRYAVLINRLIKMSASDERNPIMEFAVEFANASEERRDVLAREAMWAILPVRADLVDPDDMRMPMSVERKRVPTKVIKRLPTREERLQAEIRLAWTEAFAMPREEVLRRIREAVAANDGSINLMALPVEDAPSLLAALTAVEVVRGTDETSGLRIVRNEERRSNGAFTTADHIIKERI